MKKTNKKLIIIIIVVVLLLMIVGVVGLGVIISKSTKQAMKMMSSTDTTYEVAKTDVKQEISTSGTVIGVNEIAYTSPVTAKVEDIKVEVGQIVHEGDMLLTFDTSELGDNLRKVQIQAKSEKAAGNASYEAASEANAKAQEAQGNVSTLKQQISEIKDKISSASSIVEKYKEQNAVNMIPNDMDEDADVSGEEQTIPEPETKNKKKSSKDTIDKKTYKQAVSDLEELNDELLTKQGELEKQEMIVESADAAKVTGSQATQISAANELADLSVNEAQESVDKAEAGIVAQKTGYVTSVSVVKGAYANETQTLITVVDCDAIGVEFPISKDDLGSISSGQKARVVIGGNEYTGKVDFVSKVAAIDETLTGATTSTSIKGRIVLDKPDDSIYIGVSAKAYIFVGESKDALAIPYESLCSDIDGDYVFVVNDKNIIERKDIKTGIYSDEYYEVLEGISEGDKVITAVTKNMKPGDEYVETQAAMSPMMP